MTVGGSVFSHARVTWGDCLRFCRTSLYAARVPTSLLTPCPLCKCSTSTLDWCGELFSTGENRAPGCPEGSHARSPRSLMLQRNSERFWMIKCGPICAARGMFLTAQASTTSLSPTQRRVARPAPIICDGGSDCRPDAGRIFRAANNCVVICLLWVARIPGSTSHENYSPIRGCVRIRRPHGSSRLRISSYARSERTKQCKVG